MEETNQLNSDISFKLKDSANILKALDQLKTIEMSAAPAYWLGRISDKTRSIVKDYSDGARAVQKKYGNFYVEFNGEKYFEKNGKYENEAGRTLSDEELRSGLQLFYDFNNDEDKSKAELELTELGETEDKLDIIPVKLDTLKQSGSEQLINLRPEIMESLAGVVIVI